MLERPRLLLRLQPAGWDILDGDSRELVGSARPRPRPGPLRLLDAWLRPAGWLVREAPDDSLLFTAVRQAGWPFAAPRWRVRDAQDGPLGTVGPAAVASGQIGIVCEPRGRVYALLGANAFRRPDGRLLAELDGATLAFGSELADEPLAKMLLLAAALWRLDPGGRRG